MFILADSDPIAAPYPLVRLEKESVEPKSSRPASSPQSAANKMSDLTQIVKIVSPGQPLGSAGVL